MKVIVIGGGYAGLAAVIELRHTLPKTEMHVVDPRENHLKATHLHRTLYHPLNNYQIPFAALAKRFYQLEITRRYRLDNGKKQYYWWLPRICRQRND